MLMPFYTLYLISGFCIYTFAQLEDSPPSGLSTTFQCAVRKTISPCTCDAHSTTADRKIPWIIVKCLKMKSFADVVEILKEKFSLDVEIRLAIERSNLEDMSSSKFVNIHPVISWLSMTSNNLPPELSNSTFEGINRVTSFILSDSKIKGFPGTIFKHMPKIDTVSLSRTFIKSISPADFESLPELRQLIIQESNLTCIENGTFPTKLRRISLSSNNITTLNHTIKNNYNLEYIWLQNNVIESIHEQLPDNYTNNNTRLLDITSNKVSKLPESLGNLLTLDRLLAAKNKLTSLDTVVSRMSNLSELDVSENKISQISQNEFENCARMTILNLAFNEIKSLNKSLLNATSLEKLNVSHNQLEEFSLEEISGLRLEYIDLSHNNISTFIGKMDSGLFPLKKIRVHQLSIQFNQLEHLEGSLGGITGLKYLNMSHNNLKAIPSLFFVDLQALKYLDISHNDLQALPNISKELLPSLDGLYASHNLLTNLKYDLAEPSPVCSVDLSYNQIVSIDREFIQINLCNIVGVDRDRYIDLNGNEVLCSDDAKDSMKSIELKMRTKFKGQCGKMPNEQLKYTVNNTDSSPITVITLDEKI